MDIGGIIFFSYLFLGLVFGLIGGSINENKGCSYWTGFWCGFLLGLIGLLIVALQKDKTKENKILYNSTELERFKKLADDGTITQNEFEAVKKKTLKKYLGEEMSSNNENNVIICENCYEENEGTRKTCKNCGAKLYKNREI